MPASGGFGYAVARRWPPSRFLYCVDRAYDVEPDEKTAEQTFPRFLLAMPPDEMPETVDWYR